MVSLELNFSLDANYAHNLSRLSGESSIITAQRLMELADIADDMAECAASFTDIGLLHTDVLAVFCDSLELGGYEISDLVSGMDIEGLERSISHISDLDAVFLSEMYVSAAKKRGLRIDESDFLPPPPLGESFTYVRNSLSDEAYDVFSADFNDPRVSYSSSFKECAARLADGDVTYCLLPLEERGGVRLPTVSELIMRNDLKINAVTPVFGPDAGADMKYALVSRGFKKHERRDGDDRYLEIRLDKDGEPSLTKLMSALGIFGMDVYAVDTLTIGNEGEGNTCFTLVIKDGADGFTPLLVYLALIGADYVSVGMYKNIE